MTASPHHPLVLKTAFGTYGNTQALKDDPRLSERLSLEHVEVRPNVAIFRRMLRDLEFDLAEMAITTYILARAFDKGFTALPIFITRDFHHSTIVYNTSSGVRT